MPDTDGVMGLVDCPTCNTRIYQYNQHTCTECSASVCYYCESQHADNHKKEDTSAPLPK